MPKYILTGTPGAGKTAVLRLLEVNGHAVVEEAATDVIALDNACGHEESWRDRAFVDRVVALQRQRELAAPQGVVFFDRSPVCTLALCRHLGFAVPDLLARAVDRARNEYETTVFFLRNQGFVRPTAARRLSFEESLAFELLHEQAYRELGFQLADVPAGPLADRAALIERTIE